ncbi:MAG: ribonuclease P protein component [Spirochaetaceae bacterium]|nr:ribonuclease P protein component [Spirochaetaceae bacterium]
MCLNAAGPKGGINLPSQTKKSPISTLRLTFSRQEHLKKRVEITRVFKKGKVVSCFGARLFFLENGLPHNRLVVTFARKFGNAVRRNRARRLSHEGYRLMKAQLKTGYDLVLLMYPREKDRAEAGLAASTGQLKALLTRAGIR